MRWQPVRMEGVPFLSIEPDLCVGGALIGLTGRVRRMG